ncbi:hypothetical protein [Synechocystis sp. LKSZ1]|uniref:hypothetical protein n=1 Tax=Synechocystis sp. LKSZ1 TaxID=3144951 RepID=UPI00336C0789
MARLDPPTPLPSTPDRSPHPPSVLALRPERLKGLSFQNPVLRWGVGGLSLSLLLGLLALSQTGKLNRACLLQSCPPASSPQPATLPPDPVSPPFSSNVGPTLTSPEQIAVGPKGTGATPARLQAYRQELQTLQQQRQRDTQAQRHYQTAQSHAQVAQQKASAQQWIQAVNHWQAALQALQQIPDQSFWASQRQALLAAYIPLLRQAQLQLHNALQAQQAKQNLEQLCNPKTQYCQYQLKDQQIQVQLTAVYLQRLWDAALRAKVENNPQDQAQILNHIAYLEKILQSISNQAHRPLVLYHAQGQALTQYQPQP